MATSGSFTGSIRNGDYSIRIDWEQTKNVNDNTSTVTCKMYFTNKYGIDIGSRPDNSITIKGTKYTISSSAIESSSGTHYIGKCSKTISHNSDGSIGTFTISAAFQIRATISGTYFGTITASKSGIQLDSIPRCSTISVNKTTAKMGEQVTFTIERASSNFTHKILGSFEGYNFTIGTNVTTSKTWTVSDLATKIPNAVKGALVVTLETYNGTTKLGSKNINMTLEVPDDVLPTVEISVTDANANVNLPADTFATQLSKLHIVNNPKGAKGSTIKLVKTTANNIDYYINDITTSPLTSVAYNTVTVTVTDSRGRTNTITKNITVLQYNKPYISTFTAERSDWPNTVTVSLNAGTSNIGVEVRTYTVKWKLKNSEEWQSQQLDNSQAVIDTVFNVSCDDELEYDFVATIDDSHNTAEYAIEAPTTFVLMDFKANGKGIAIGKVADVDGFDCQIPAYFVSAKINDKPVLVDEDWITFPTDELSSKASLPEYDFVYPIQYRKIGNHVYIRGRIKTLNAYDMTEFTILNMPVNFRPKKTVTYYSKATTTYFACMRINKEGNLILEQVYNFLTGGKVGGTINWIDITIDYFTD